MPRRPRHAQLTDEEAAKLLGKAGYAQQDFDALSNFEKLSDAEGCAVTVKLLSSDHLVIWPDATKGSRFGAHAAAHTATWNLAPQ